MGINRGGRRRDRAAEITAMFVKAYGLSTHCGLMFTARETIEGPGMAIVKRAIPRRAHVFYITIKVNVKSVGVAEGAVRALNRFKAHRVTRVRAILNSERRESAPGDDGLERNYRLITDDSANFP